MEHKLARADRKSNSAGRALYDDGRWEEIDNEILLIVSLILIIVVEVKYRRVEIQILDLNQLINKLMLMKIVL